MNQKQCRKALHTSLCCVSDGFRYACSFSERHQTMRHRNSQSEVIASDWSYPSLDSILQIPLNISYLFSPCPLVQISPLNKQKRMSNRGVSRMSLLGLTARQWYSILLDITVAQLLSLNIFRNAHYSPHSHPGLTTHLILSGTFTVCYPDDDPNKKETFGPGARIDIPARKIHEAWMGAEGCTYVIGE